MNKAEEILGFYDEDYLHFSAHTVGAERTENEVSFIWQALSLKSGASALDLGCGHGRIANALAHRGADVTAIEILTMFLKRAEDEAVRAGLMVDYRQADIRESITAGPFDAAIMWFFSFGYHSDEETLDVLRHISRGLKPGAQLLFDQYNVSALARAADNYRLLDFGDSLLIQKPSGIWKQAVVVLKGSWCATALSAGPNLPAAAIRLPNCPTCLRKQASAIRNSWATAFKS